MRKTACKAVNDKTRRHSSLSRFINIIRVHGQDEISGSLDFVEVDFEDLVVGDGEFVETECTEG